MLVRGIRGAVTVEANNAQAILEGTKELLTKIITINHLQPEDICSAYFTVTKDLTSGFPAKAARQLGWRHVPLMCAQEIDVPGSLPLCIRVLLHVNTTKSQKDIKHVYLREAISLRPDLFHNH
jgi:chorismate mutase